MKIEALNLDFDIYTSPADVIAANSPKGFWSQPLGEESNHKPTRFDWAFGVTVPLFCVAADPIVFRGGGPGGPLLAAYRPFAYLLSIASILAMAAWLLWGPKLKWLAAPISGLFYVGGAISLLVGVVLFPFSVLGMFFLIGFLGFTPLFSALVFLRHAKRAYTSSLMTLEDQAAWQAAFLAGLFSIVIPYVMNVQIVRSVNELAAGDVNTIRRETRKLKFVGPLVDLGAVSKRYRRFDDPDKETPRARALAHAYQEITGSDIEDGPYGWD